MRDMKRIARCFEAVHEEVHEARWKLVWSLVESLCFGAKATVTSIGRGLRRNVRALHRDMERWMVVEGYGKVLARPGLDLPTRELCIVAILAATGWEPQLHSHLRGALHAGCDPVSVSEALEAGLEMNPEPAWRNGAKSLWERVAARYPARHHRGQG